MTARATTLAEPVHIRVGHSPDPDDAFMFHALANDKIPTPGYRFTHDLVDIETLNRRALEGNDLLELTAVSLHGMAFLTDRYAICNCGASMGDGYGPRVVAREPWAVDDLRGKRIAVPGTLTTAFLSLKLILGDDFEWEVRDFDKMLDVVESGEFDAGLVIHEGQLTYPDQGLHLVVDTGVWFRERTGLPLPLGCNAIRKDLGAEAMNEVTAILKRSIQYGLEHRREALDYAAKWGRGLDDARNDEFVAMYVNDWTLDFGDRGRAAVRELLRRGYEAGVIPEPAEVTFVG